MSTGWIARTCIGGGMGARMTVGAGAVAMLLICAWVGGTQRAGSTIDQCARGGVELENARFGPLSRAKSSAISAAIWLTVL
ncbi:hypothetical protein CDL15_Pgr017588 [Punica granatum]|uniref:Uncharacterized protein n=1 Tax=Punica granatum TaxID=22663 RepID=A0A218W6U3_PUNGR|nr:hypothetical protein CDL15_Pgr017588 [Punica granatum]